MPAEARLVSSEKVLDPQLWQSGEAPTALVVPMLWGMEILPPMPHSRSTQNVAQEWGCPDCPDPGQGGGMGPGLLESPDGP